MRATAPAARAIATVQCRRAAGSLPYMQNGAPIGSSTRRAPERSSTSSISCRRTAASTISSRVSRRGYRRERENLQRAKPSRSSRSASIEYVIDHSAAAMFAACHGTGKLPGTKCRNDGFDKEATKADLEVSSIRSTSTFRTTTANRISTWRTKACWRTACSNRTSTRASSATSTLSRRRRLSVDLPYGQWGCFGGSGRIGPDDHAAAPDRSDRRAPASTIRRSATNSTRRNSRGDSTPASTAARRAATASFWSSYQADTAHLLRARLDARRHHAELEVHHRRARG